MVCHVPFHFWGDVLHIRVHIYSSVSAPFVWYLVSLPNPVPQVTRRSRAAPYIGNTAAGTVKCAGGALEGASAGLKLEGTHVIDNFFRANKNKTGAESVQGREWPWPARMTRTRARLLHRSAAAEMRGGGGELRPHTGQDPLAGM